MKKIICFFLLIAFTAFSQSKPIFCDCLKAEKLNLGDSLRIGPTQAPKNAGLEEINYKDTPNAFDKEHHTAWYLIKIKKCGVLTFTVIPEQKTDDYDFMLFKADSANACQRIKEARLLILRSNNSRNDSSGIGLTGLSLTTKNKFAVKGKHSSFSQSVNVKENEEYILVLNNIYNGGKGFVLDIKNSPVRDFTVYSYDYYLKSPMFVDATFTDSTGHLVTWIGQRSHHTTNEVGDVFHAKRFTFLKLTEKGHFPEYIMRKDMSCENNGSKIYLKKAFKDSSYVFQKIYFNPDLSLNFYLSKYSLYTYMQFLDENRKINIEISGISSEYIKTEEDYLKAAGSFRQYFVTKSIMDYRIKINPKPVKGLIDKNQVRFKIISVK